MKKRDFKNIGKLVQKKRASMEQSQTQLAIALGYRNGQFVSNIERGICSIPFEKILLLASVLGLNSLDIKEAILLDYSNTIDGFLGDIPAPEVTGTTHTVSEAPSQPTTITEG